MTRSLLFAGAAIAFPTYAISMIIGMYYGIRAASHRSPDAPYRWLVAANRFNAAWFTDQLSPTGLRYRERAMWAGRVMCASGAALLIFALLTSFASNEH
jgi:hypothetical protein